MLNDDEDVPPLDPKKVALFGMLLGAIVFAGWRFWTAHQAVKAVAEATKDYRKLFPARSEEVPEPEVPRALPGGARTQSGIGMLKIDDDMRQPRAVRAPAVEKEEAPPPPPAATVRVEAAANPQPKAVPRPKLNSGAFSGLNGGSGLTFGGNAGTLPTPDKK